MRGLLGGFRSRAAHHLLVYLRRRLVCACKRGPRLVVENCFIWFGTLDFVWNVHRFMYLDPWFLSYTHV